MWVEVGSNQCSRNATKQDTCDGVTEEPLGSVTRRTPHKTEQFIQYWNKQQESCLLLAELMCKELHGTQRQQSGDQKSCRALMPCPPWQDQCPACPQQCHQGHLRNQRCLWQRERKGNSSGSPRWVKAELGSPEQLPPSPELSRAHPHQGALWEEPRCCGTCQETQRWGGTESSCDRALWWGPAYIMPEQVHFFGIKTPAVNPGLAGCVQTSPEPGGQVVPTEGLSSALPRGYLFTWEALGAGASPSPSRLFFRWRIFHLKYDNFLSTTSEWWLLPEFSQLPLWFVHHMDISVYSTTLTARERKDQRELQ